MLVSSKKILIAITLLLIIQSGFSQTKSENNFLIDLRRGVSFEVSPYTGAMGKSGIFGLRLSMNYSSLNLEFAGEQVIGTTANLYPLALNFLLNLSTKGRLLPYGVLGGGLFITKPTTAIGAETVSTMGLNFGGGARFYLTRNFGLRFEAKQFITNVTNELTQNDELLIFQEFSIGVSFMFQ